ncbi:MarR family winged helix-turn-helix transcriptional regulator [Microbacterium sp. NPDC055988]|uniref:MarR family winged helix-turn-helix transcriptional regulator n=1 Tax=Microbacterium sp. NPDC055988 TaxID=3345671 RepID=UPI0035D71E8F
MSVALNVLEEGGFVARSPHPSDRRRNLVTLTASGRGELTRLDAVVDRAQEQFLAPLADEERVVFLDLLRRVGATASA